MADSFQIMARDVAEAVLEQTGIALMARDFESFAVAFQVPHVMVTTRDVIHIESLDDMRLAFDQLCNHFAEIGLTELDRSVVAAEYTSPSRIETTHVSQHLKDGECLNVPYPVFSVLERIDGTWKITKGEYALDPSSGEARAMAFGKPQKSTGPDAGAI